MSRGSSDEKMIRKTKDQLRRPTPEDLDRMLARSLEPIDTTEEGGAPEITGPFVPAELGQDGRPVRKKPDKLRDAILAQLPRLGINRGELYRRAKVYCPSLSESAVYKYLRGVRDVSTPCLAALLEAAELEIQPRKAVPRKTDRATPSR